MGSDFAHCTGQIHGVRLCTLHRDGNPLGEETIARKLRLEYEGA